MRVCGAVRGQTASSYLEPLYDKALMEQLLMPARITVSKVRRDNNQLGLFSVQPKVPIKPKLLRLQCLSNIQ